MMNDKKNGYDLAEEVFKRIGEDKNHEISYNDMINVISFWGFNEEADRATTIGFVCYCARLKLKKVFERALVYGDYRMYDAFIKQIENRRYKNESIRYNN